MNDARGSAAGEPPLQTLYERITEAHARIQRDFGDIDPVVGVNRQMRAGGIPADAITIDSLKNDKRILLILHDRQPELVSYQFCQRNQDPDDAFANIALAGLTTDRLYAWIKEAFATGD